MHGSLLDGLDVESIQPAELEVSQVSYAVASTKKGVAPRKLLSNVSCHFPPGKLSAIMGASGAGKTTLMTLLRGLVSPGSTKVGRITCNGYDVDAEQMRSVASFVPQEDVYLAALTPREMLDFNARLRLPKEHAKAERVSRVDNVIKTLGLESCADTKIGNEKEGVRGISSGERRRLSIGLAVVGGLPKALLCDEPTSGLDSASASNMIALLQTLAEHGVTVICSVHQPSFALFSTFNFLVLLHDGMMCYAGAIESVEKYFSGAGCPTPAHTNPAHHYIDSIQGSDKWSQLWNEKHVAYSEKLTPSARAEKSQVGRAELPMLRQTEVLTRRGLIENFSNKKKFFRGIMSRLPASTLIGFFFWQIAATHTQQSVFVVKGVIFIAVNNPLIESFYAGASTFSSTKGLLKREYYDGLYSVTPYYLAYYLGFLAMQIPWTFAWAVPLYFLSGFRPDIDLLFYFLGMTFCVIFISCAAGSFIGTKIKDQDGSRAVLAPCLVPMVLFSGYVIPYSSLSEVWMPLYYLNPLQWAITGLETKFYEGAKFVDCDGSIPLSMRHCFATGEEYLAVASSDVARTIGTPGVFAILLGYLLFFVFMNVRAVRTFVLDGRL
mmetsp:Transcript_17611/g.48337  ORF Transcript_17611/g.48337 Transcript_17611/m.48337 type:complete len:607 (-) Transcript_17611:134-1954(-)|eukprot:CAMPEP_0117556148 /NCGR_PEP_ID=MMETSP0784-20121206/51651_1 /TAXON_ID=39447 /ORGANISM="" /LENGTH=606 /DNA_ID=CAMNT_0005353397 /DNA_START=32 /DNA_END=1852 /DNA_ORIENTATION=-